MSAKRAKRKKGIQYIWYDYEEAYNKSLEDMNEFFIRNMFKRGKKVVYALKEIKAGEQFEVEIYPQFKNFDDIPEKGRVKKSNKKAQRNLNDKNARKYLERVINKNFNNDDIWITLTYDNEHLPKNFDEALRNMQNFIKRVNYKRRKKGFGNAKYVYVTEHIDREGKTIRWHHHIVMDGILDMDAVESCWKLASRNEIRRLQKDENGLSGMANYIVKEEKRNKSEKRWNSSQGLKDPDIRVVYSKKPIKDKGNYKKIDCYVEKMKLGHEEIREQAKKWYPDYDFTEGGAYYNDFNALFYIKIRMRKRAPVTINKCLTL